MSSPVLGRGQEKNSHTIIRARQLNFRVSVEEQLAGLWSRWKQKSGLFKFQLDSYKFYGLGSVLRISFFVSFIMMQKLLGLVVLLSLLKGKEHPLLWFFMVFYD